MRPRLRRLLPAHCTRWIGALLAAVGALSVFDGAPASASGAVVFSSTRAAADGFVIKAHPSTLWTVGDDGTGMRRLVDPEGSPIDGWDPSWSPLGNAIAYVENAMTGDHWQLSFVSADGRRRRALAVEGDGSSFQAINDPDWSPDDRWIAFSAHTADRFGVDAARLWQTDIHLASVDGSEVRRLTGRGPGGEKLWDEEPSFSPDGQRILFTRTTEMTLPGRRPPGSGLYSVGLQGGEPKPVFVGEFPADDKSPPAFGAPTVRGASFSPDGREIAFLVSDTLYTVASDGSRLRALGKVGTQMVMNTGVVPAWDPAPLFIVSEPFEPLLKLYPDGSTAPLTRVPEDPELRAEFVGDADPDWRPAAPLPIVPDVLPPATLLFDRARPRLLAAAAAARRRSLTLRRRNLSFFAADSAGVAAVHVALARGAKRRRGRAMCRFLAARRFTRPRPCARPSYRRVRSAGTWQRLRRLRPGRYLLWLRTTDGHGNKKPTQPVQLRLRR